MPIPGSPSTREARRRRRRPARRAPRRAAASSALAPDGRAGRWSRSATVARAYRGFRGPVQGAPPMFAGPPRSEAARMPSTPTEGTHMQPSRNIAARAGRWSARHRKTAILGWIAFVVLAFVVGGKVGTNTLTTEQSGVGESGQADRIVADAYPESVERDGPRPERRARDRRSRVPRRGRRRRDSASSGSRASPRSPTRTARTRGADLRRRPCGAGEPSRSPATARRRRGRRRSSTPRSPPSSAAAEGAPRAARRAVGRRQLGGGVQGDLRDRPRRRRARRSLPITLLILLIAFGAIVAAGIPLLLAITGVVGDDGPRRPAQPAHRRSTSRSTT